MADELSHRGIDAWGTGAIFIVLRDEDRRVPVAAGGATSGRLPRGEAH